LNEYLNKSFDKLLNIYQNAHQVIEED